MDKEAFISLLHHAKIHAEAGSKIENPDLFESVVMSILVEHQKELQQLQGRLLQPQTKTCPRCGKTSAIEDYFKGNTIGDGVTILCQDCREVLFYVPSNKGGFCVTGSWEIFVGKLELVELSFSTIYFNFRTIFGIKNKIIKNIMRVIPIITPFINEKPLSTILKITVTIVLPIKLSKAPITIPSINIDFSVGDGPGGEAYPILIILYFCSKNSQSSGQFEIHP